MSSNPRRRSAGRPEHDAGNGLMLKTNVALRKGATFHSTMTPPSTPPAAFRVPSLPRRSQTNLEDVVDAARRRMEMTLGPIESSLTAVKAEISSPFFRDESLPVPQVFLSQEPCSINMEKHGLRSRHRLSARHHESDSGLGTSVASKDSKVSTGIATAITRSATANGTENIPCLSQRAFSRIHEHTLRPLLAKASLKDFHPIVNDCPRLMQENQICCLRDLEKTLIFMAPERAKSAELFLDFCTTSIRCIQATVEYLSDHEQTRPSDRPYTSGYFIDLVEQIRQHAAQIRAARERETAGEKLNDMDVDPTDEVKLMGGLSSNGRPAELVRIKKNGKAFSMATGEPVEEFDEDTKGPIRFKRSMSEILQDDEEILRSMARRKKNAPPEEPKQCKEPGCNKIFQRPCDLTKHEKTHSRPWKCPVPTCKYNTYGWPTEKEMIRHKNDKHDAAPPMFECLFKPCPYKSKRESNCKQHMEKAHGWTYVRTKTNGKKSSSKDDSSAPTPLIPSLPTPGSDHMGTMMTPPEEPLNFSYSYSHKDGSVGYSSGRLSDYSTNLDFPAYNTSDEFFDAAVPFDSELQLDLDYSPISNDTPSTDSVLHQEPSPELAEMGQFDDIYGAHVQVPTPTFSMFGKSNIVPQTYMNFVPDSHQVSTAPHISPIGQGNAMLFTPASLADLDEGFEDLPPNELGRDFVLFPQEQSKSLELDNSLFITPSSVAGFSQPSSQDFNIDYSSAMGWSTDYPSANYNDYQNPQQDL